MNPGRELDALIAEKIFNLPQSTWREVKYYGDESGVGILEIGVEPDPYSTNIAAAWEIVEKLRGDGFIVEVHLYPTRKKWLKKQKDGTWGPEQGKVFYRCRIARYNDLSAEWISVADSAAHAICLAALKRYRRIK